MPRTSFPKAAPRMRPKRFGSSPPQPSLARPSRAQPLLAKLAVASTLLVRSPRTPAPFTGAHILEMADVTCTFGGLTAVDAVRLEVQRGQIFSVIGPNGAGKTTLFNLISGIYRPTSGAILFEGRSLAGCTPDAVLRRGIARTFQNIRLFNNMTVLENVLVGQHITMPGDLVSILCRLPAYRLAERTAHRRALDLLAFFGPRMVALKDEYAANLSYADRRRVEIARALGAAPRLLLLDEPTAGMNDTETRDAITYILRLRDEFALTILLIEHKLQVTMGISDRIAALNYGKKIAEGQPTEIQRHPDVITSYLGSAAPSQSARR